MVGVYLILIQDLQSKHVKGKKESTVAHRRTFLRKLGESVVFLDISKIKEVPHAQLGPIWYYSEPSNVPYSPNQFLGWDFFLPLLTARRL